MPDRVDQFESIFKRADKARFEYRRPEIKHVTLVTDLDEKDTAALLQRVQQFLAVLEPDGLEWHTLGEGDYDRKSELLDKLVQQQADLIVTSRNLRQSDKNTPHSLGVYLDTLTQATPTPVLVLPDAEHRGDGRMTQTASVMVATDHLAGDARLISHAVRFTQAAGHVHLCHVEDDAAFAYYLDAISKIPAIDTAIAEQTLREQLLKQPADYIAHCIEVLHSHGQTATLHAHVLMGHRLRDYRRLIDQHRIDLLVLNTKDQDQQAMHGLAYPIAVEFRDIPLLML
ncbi:MAG: hypothetical protein IID41_17765 [Planctomycetes bacterium]|nr:hypothetical protein [Planctomycetota bacterium]